MSILEQHSLTFKLCFTINGAVFEENEITVTLEEFANRVAEILKANELNQVSASDAVIEVIDRIKYEII